MALAVLVDYPPGRYAMAVSFAIGAGGCAHLKGNAFIFDRLPAPVDLGIADRRGPDGRRGYKHFTGQHWLGHRAGVTPLTQVAVVIHSSNAEGTACSVVDGNIVRLSTAALEAALRSPGDPAGA